MFPKYLGNAHKSKRALTTYRASYRGTSSAWGLKRRRSRNIQIEGLPLALVLLFYCTKAQLSAGMCSDISNACSVMHFPTVLFLLILLAVLSSVKYYTKWILLVICWNHVRECSSLGLSCLLAKGAVSIRLQGRLPRSPNNSGVSWYLAPFWFFPEFPRCTDV